MTIRDLAAPLSASSTLIRNEPVQARSTARLAALLDAAAAVIDEIGYERLTTAMVAERAGASIGTVYRYFPDRIAVLQSLASRNYERMIDRLRVGIADEGHSTWLEAMSDVFEIFVDAFRTEPGFGALRLGDVLDLRPAEGQTANGKAASELLDALVARFGIGDTPEVRLAFEAAIEVTDALVARAFARDAEGDARFLDHGRETVYAMLAGHFGSPQAA